MSGGSQTTKTKGKQVATPPQWYEDAAVKALQVADRINQAGYTPYMGNEIAAFTPMQQSAMQSASDWMSAANGTAKTDAMAGMPQATTDGSGVSGYGSAQGMMRNLELIKERFPQQYALLTQFGGDLLSNPSQAPGSVANSPWNVGAAAAARNSGTSGTSGASGGGSGSGADTAGGLFPFGFQSPVQGGKGPASAINMFYSMGMPGMINGQDMSIYKDQYMKALTAGKNPNVGMPWYSEPTASAPAAPAAAPVSYSNPQKWW